MTLLAPPRSVDIEPRPSIETEIPPAVIVNFIPAEPTESEIALEAYLRYLARGSEDGHAVEDWLEAEQALRQRFTPAIRTGTTDSSS